MLSIVINMKIMKWYTMYIFSVDLGSCCLCWHWMSDLRLWCKNTRKVFVLVLTTKSSLHHCLYLPTYVAKNHVFHSPWYEYSHSIHVGVCCRYLNAQLPSCLAYRAVFSSVWYLLTAGGHVRYVACRLCSSTHVFSRPYWVVRSRLWYDVLSVCLSSVCNVLYCG